MRLTAAHYSPDVDVDAVADYLGESPLFACLGAQDRLVLAGKMRVRHFARSEVVFHNDDPAGHVFLITSGTVKVSVPDEQGHEVVVALQRSSMTARGRPPSLPSPRRTP